MLNGLCSSNGVLVQSRLYSAFFGENVLIWQVVFHARPDMVLVQINDLYEQKYTSTGRYRMETYMDMTSQTNLYTMRAFVSSEIRKNWLHNI